MKISVRIFSCLCLFQSIDIALLFALDYPRMKIEETEKEQKKEETKLPERYLDRAIDPKTYIVGPGDVFLVTFHGVAAEPLSLQLLPEGLVSIPGVGEVELGAVSLKEAKQKISDALKSRYRDTRIGISLAGIRLFKVAVTGAVEKPGMVLVSASDRVSEAIDLAWGLQKKGSERNIKLVESPSDTVIADLAYFHATGNLDYNPYLHEGQVIFVPVVSDTFDKIEVYGAVNAPGVFEFKPGDRISDLLTLAFSAGVNADLEEAELIRMGDEESKLVSIRVNLRKILAEPNATEDLYLMPDDRLFVRAIADYHRKAEVTIAGQVKYPGTYPIEDGCRMLSELVAKAGGVLETASLSEAEMYRNPRFYVADKGSFDRLLQLSIEKLSNFELQYLKTISGSKLGKVAVNFDALLVGNNFEADVPLVDGDVVLIPERSYMVTIMGQVVNPGLVPYHKDRPVEYYIALAGGYGYKADKGNIRIVKAHTGSLVKPGRKAAVEMGDQIMVPQQTEKDAWKFIRDVGLFMANLATIYIVIDQAIN